MALDRARMKERFAGFLIGERTRRGGGDARRFPQPEMARLLSIGLRQYQRWEDPHDPMLPFWRNLEEIAERLDVEVGVLIGADAETAGRPRSPVSDEAAYVNLLERLDHLEALEAEDQEWRQRIEEKLDVLVRRLRDSGADAKPESTSGS